MTSLAFDTHRYVKRLIAVGMPENQAEVIADEQRALIEDQLATKQDIKALEAATKQDIAATRREIKELETTIKALEVNTRRDIKESEAATQLKFKELEAATQLNFEKYRRDMKEMDQKQTIRLGIMMAASLVALSTLIKIL